MLKHKGMSEFLAYIDNKICSYLGIHQQDINPDSIKKIGNNLILRNTESFKRHLYNERLDQFLDSQLNNLSTPDQRKLGISLGKAIANNLIVSFDTPLIRRE